MAELETVVITRHAALAAYLVEVGAVPSTARVIPHASAEDVRGRHVVGPIPLHLAALAASVIRLPLEIPAELRGVELTLDQVRSMARLDAYDAVNRVLGCGYCGWDGLPCMHCAGPPTTAAPADLAGANL